MTTTATIKVGDDYADAEFELLFRHLELLDLEIKPICATIARSRKEGLCDAGEYFIGHGFVAIQRYLTATRAGLGVTVADAFGMPPILSNGVSFAAAVNAGANYWKHSEEWIEVLNKSDSADLQGVALKTLRQLEEVAPWEEYTCANLLALLLEGEALELSRLLPKIAEWRNNLFARHQ